MGRVVWLTGLCLFVGGEAAAQYDAEAPPPPASAAPVTAPPAEVPAGLPPHPAFPEPLDEPQPTASELAATDFVWLPGHWIWTGERYEWQSGRWIHPLPGYVLVPPRWEWNGEAWVFHHAGWAPLGSDVVAYAPVPVTEESFAAQAPVDVYAEPRSSVYYWAAGAYVAPLVLYPRWHPYYHYYYALGYPYYVSRPPLYHSPWYRYHRYGVAYRFPAYRPPLRPLPRYRPPPPTTPRRVTRPVGPSTYFRGKPESWSPRSSYRPPSYRREMSRPAPRTPGYSPSPRPAPRAPGYSPSPSPRGPSFSPAPRGPSFSPAPSRPAPAPSPGGGGGPRR